MHFIIVSGSLGVDRHSIIRGLMRSLRSDGSRRVAVISSQHGEPCMDDSFISDNGVLARDMKGGCVSCSLKTDLVSIMREIHLQGRPEFVIFEPSGTTDPGKVKDALDDAVDLDVHKVTFILVLDACTFEKTWSMFQRPLRNHMREADLVLVYGWEDISDEDRHRFMGRLVSLGLQGEVVPVTDGHVNGSALWTELL
ncbi:MAG: GTP-binding protein [Candidatus Methanomethylophilaceae archaeon]|nr:GTP-binding protein [Candidatus Methanomethylophilaceae archaeon]